MLELLAEPLADGMTRGQALRWAALLHDAAKPATRSVRVLDRRVTFFGHDVQGASSPGTCSDACVQACVCASTSRHWCATTCALAFSYTSPSR